VGGLLGIGVGIAALTAFPSVAMAVVGMLTVGFSASFLVVPSQTLLQEETPPQMLGRVGGSMMSVMMGSQVVALAIAGPVEEKIGVRAVFFASAGLLALIALAGHLRLRNHVPPKAESVNA
jgi:DHA3 family macrolide efflux protein-like MFS transporter